MRILGLLALVTLMAVAAMSAAGCGGTPVGEELARLNYDGENYVLVEYGDKLAVFHSGGAPVNSRDRASQILHSYAWTQELAGEGRSELSRVAARVEDIDSDISVVRTAANATAGIFEQLEDLEASIPLLGTVSAYDVVAEVYPGLSGVRSIIRSLSQSLNDFGNDAETLAAAARRLDNAQVSSGIDGREMDQAARNGASAANGLAETVASVENSVSDARGGVSDLVSALRDAADTPLIGGAIGEMASAAARFESQLDDLESGLADLGGDLQDAASAFEGILSGVSENHENLMDRWLQEPHDSQWPPLDPERRPAGIAASGQVQSQGVSGTAPPEQNREPGTARPEDQHRAGSLVWRYETGGGLISSPAVVDGVVYIGSGDDHLYAIQAQSGELLWRYQTVCCIGKPVIADGAVYFWSKSVHPDLDNSHLQAIDARTSKILWRYETTPHGVAGLAVADGVVFASRAPDEMFSVDARTGELLWRFIHDGVFPPGWRWQTAWYTQRQITLPATCTLSRRRAANSSGALSLA